MARAKKTSPLDRKLIAVPTKGPTFKAVLLVWLLCTLPTFAGATYVAYQRYPQPFQDAFKASEGGVKRVFGVYTGWQDGRTKAAKAAEAKRKQAAEQAAAEAGGSMF